MKFIYLLIILLTFYSRNNRSNNHVKSIDSDSINKRENDRINNTHSNNDSIDTSYLKSIKWDSLNEFVKYHIIKWGKITSNVNHQYKTEILSVFYYYNHRFDTSNTFNNKFDSLKKFNCDALKTLIQNNTFCKYSYIDCLFKISSNILYKIKPKVLAYVFVAPQKNASKSKLLSLLKKENYTEKIEISSSKRTALDTLLKLSNDSIMKITVKDNYRNLIALRNICNALKKNKDVDNAFYNDLFTGINEYEIFYRIASVEKDN